MILHLDADAFFASVEQAACARLRGRPVAVGGMKRGIIASASYEARRLGIFTPMPTSRALRLCPHLLVLPGDFERYETFSRLMFSYFHDFSPQVEISSIDEGYCDLGGQRRLAPEDVARRIASAIARSLKITVSEGLASNKLVSQIASKLEKPRGFVHVQAGDEQSFLAPLAVNRLPGVGEALDARLHRAGLRTIGQLAGVPAGHLHAVAGNQAKALAGFALGIDPRPVVPGDEPAKSYGAQETFPQDTCDFAAVRATLRCLADGLLQKIREDTACARTVAVKIRYSDMQETERSTSLAEPSFLPEDFYFPLESLLKQAWERRVRLRMARVKFSSIYHHWPLPDLLHTLEGRDKRERLQATLAAVQGRFGKQALMRGHQWQRHRNGPPEP